jgi:hypothetical protein
VWSKRRKKYTQINELYSIVMSCDWNGSRDNSVGIAMGYRLDDLVQFQAWARDFSLLDSVHSGPEAHPASYTVDTEVCFLGIKKAGA